ncbi:hypothetical protein BHAOGJBA_4465 [Methylobacterium hispanicum]|uniref:Uncharacterized protein n=1 Tax=Methylobacterium hispanicum TaxID=270350 RepID=A0AAV4ZQT1_9HYPH|nr:hypothetical protein [Methylobacterium hispanicum]GJD90921.1 hypothetical protein BHAOGJBA_4465 [Methylobacterium hispanicum]
MVYSVTTWRNGTGGFMAVSVAPPVHPGLLETALKGLSTAHFFMDDSERMAQFARAISEADDAQIELGRLQILHVLKEIAERMDRMRFDHPMSVGASDQIGEALRSVVEGIAGDVVDLLRQADETPRDKGTLRYLAGALQTLAEAKRFTALLHEADPRNAEYAELAADAAGHFEARARDADRLRTTVGPRYGHVTEMLPASTRIATEADHRFTLQAELDGAILTPDHVLRTMQDCGDRDTLWRASQGGLREKAIKDGRHVVLPARDAAALRTKAAAIVTAFNALFNQPGFLALLRQGSALSRWKGLNGIHDAHDPAVEHEIRESHRGSRRGLWRRDEAELRKELDQLPADRERWRTEGRKHLSASFVLEELVSGALRGHLDGTKPVLVLRTDPATGATVGTLRGDDAGSVLAIYRDGLVGYPGAVFAVTLDAVEVAAGLPDLAGIRDQAWVGGPRKGTNYYSLEDALGCIAGGDAYSQTFFFGRQVAVVDETGTAWEPPQPPATFRPAA